MKSDVLNWAQGHRGGKLVSKETLNHRGLIELVSGLDVYQHTAEAYRRAYRALGIDIVNRVPLADAPAPVPPGEIRPHSTRPYHFTTLGVYDTAMCHTHACADPDDIWSLDVAALRYDDLITPVPHPCDAADIRSREAGLGEIGLYYPMLYTTLFMWAVELLGWEVFMVAATEEPDRFHDHFLLPCVEKSTAIITVMAQASDSPFVFVHDDLASATGPVFRMDWYERYVLPHYPQIWAGAKKLGKRIVLVADGDMTAFLPRLVEAGVDGLMFESPATPLETVIEHFGTDGRFFIGGISTTELATGTPETVRQMVLELEQQAGSCPGFALASGGGLHGDLPLDNLTAYFDARAEIGATPPDWRTVARD